MRISLLFLDLWSSRCFPLASIDRRVSSGFVRPLGDDKNKEAVEHFARHLDRASTFPPLVQIFERQQSEGEPELNELTGIKLGAMPDQHDCDKDPFVQAKAEVATAAGAAYGSIPTKGEAQAWVEEASQGAAAPVHAGEQVRYTMASRDTER